MRAACFAAVAAAVTGLALAPATATAAPAPSPKPASSTTKPSPSAAKVSRRIGTVEQRLSRLEQRSAELVERFDQAQVAYQQARSRANTATGTYRAAEAQLTQARDDLMTDAAAEYEGGSFSSAGALLSSTSGTGYLSELQTSAMLSQHTAQLVSGYTSDERTAAAAHQRANTALAVATKARQQVAQARKVTAQRIAIFRSELTSLQAQERRIQQARQHAREVAAALARQRAEQAAQTNSTDGSGGTTGGGTNGESGATGNTGGAGSGGAGSGQHGSGDQKQGSGHGANGSGRYGSGSGSGSSSGLSGVPRAAQLAVEFALAQVGKPYQWGSAGPDSYDCSGLTMASYAAAGISLPHSSADQYNYGHHVSADDLRPGDLLFYYTPIGHVTIYIGDGKMVSAPETGEDVTVLPINTSYSNDFVGATRIVG